MCVGCDLCCASWMGKGGDQLGSTTSEGYKAIQLIRQGEGGVLLPGSGKIFLRSQRFANFFAFFSFSLYLFRFLRFILF
jgi:hypothetical protein